MKPEAPHSQASAEKHTPGPIEQLLRDQEKEINRLRDVQKELLEALKAIVFKARKRGWLVAQEADCRDLVLTAETAIAKAEAQP